MRCRGTRLVARCLASVPQRQRRATRGGIAEALREQLAGVHRAARGSRAPRRPAAAARRRRCARRAPARRPARRPRAARGGRGCRRRSSAGRGRANSATPASARSFAVIWARFQKPTSSKNGIPAASIDGEPLGGAAGLGAPASIARRSPRKRPRSRSASAYSAISSWPAPGPSTARDVGRRQCPQFGVRPPAGRAPEVGQRRRHREVPGQPRALAQRREPARPEVDRVEHEHVVRPRPRASPRGSGARRRARGGGPGSSAASRSRSIRTCRAPAAISRHVARTSSVSDTRAASYTAPGARRPPLRVAREALRRRRRARRGGPRGRARRAARPARARTAPASRRSRRSPAASCARPAAAPRWRARPRARRRRARAIGYLAELFRFPDWLTADELLALHQDLAGSERGAAERARAARAGRPRRGRAHQGRAPCRRACSSGSGSRRRWWARRGSSCSTSPRARSIPSAAAWSATCCATCAAAA